MSPQQVTITQSWQKTRSESMTWTTPHRNGVTTAATVKTHPYALLLHKMCSNYVWHSVVMDEVNRLLLVAQISCRMSTQFVMLVPMSTAGHPRNACFIHWVRTSKTEIFDYTPDQHVRWENSAYFATYASMEPSPESQRKKSKLAPHDTQDRAPQHTSQIWHDDDLGVPKLDG
eukprot:scaffold178763_cov28-Prasinocladus_malaysianus.AAC.1